MKVIFKEKLFFDTRLTWVFSLFPFIVVLYILGILGILITDDNSAYSGFVIVAFGSILYLGVVFPLSGVLFVILRSLLKKDLIFESDKFILKRLFSTKIFDYRKIKNAEVSTIRVFGNGALRLKIHIISEDFEHNFTIHCICAYNELLEEMNKHFPVEVKG